MFGGKKRAGVKSYASRAALLGMFLLAAVLLARSDRRTATATPAASAVASRADDAASYRTFFIDFEDGSEANSGTSESSPWKRAPGMQGFEHAYSHESGDHFIFKGGVTWPNSVFPLDPTGEGTSSSEDYYGAEETWYTGSSYSRPVFDAEGKEMGGHDGDDNFFFDLSAGDESRNYITIEDIHFKGFNAENPSGKYGTCAGIYFFDGTHDTVDNILFNESPVGDFIEEWVNGANKTSEEARCAAVGSDLESAYYGKDESVVENSTIEGLPAEGDEPGGNFFEGIRAVPIIKNNVIKGLTQGMFPPQGGGVIEGNRIEDCGYPAFPLKYKGALHSNAIEFISAGLSVDYSRPYYIYDNVIRGTGDSGGEGGSAECETDSMEGGTYYVWNNVVTHTLGNPLLFGNAEGLGGAAKDADAFIWNNSLEGSGSGGGGCVRGDGSSEWKEIQLENNLCASTYGKFGEPGEGSSKIEAKTLTERANLIVAPSALAAKHYNSANETFPFAPADSEAVGIDQGENLGSQCSGMLTGLCEDTTCAGARTALRRPLSDKWDIGAYQYRGAEPPPNEEPGSEEKGSEEKGSTGEKEPGPFSEKVQSPGGSTEPSGGGSSSAASSTGASAGASGVCQGAGGCAQRQLSLATPRAQVRGGVTRLVLWCDGGAPASACRGTVSLSLFLRKRGGRRADAHASVMLRRVVLASASYTLPYDKRRVVTLRLSPLARSLLGRARGHSLRVRVDAALSGSSAAVQAWITLRLG
ncbi:MAG TPA: hypothetical protein VMD79_15045 [Solirubrobacteraceae bacterium]|nr:hypothetical protein [Solirubrobacteraceae bacterium]